MKFSGNFQCLPLLFSSLSSRSRFHDEVGPLSLEHVLRTQFFPLLFPHFFPLLFPPVSRRDNTLSSSLDRVITGFIHRHSRVPVDNLIPSRKMLILFFRSHEDVPRLLRRRKARRFIPFSFPFSSGEVQLQQPSRILHPLFLSFSLRYG